MLIEEHRSLKEFNTFGIDVRARYFSSFSNVEELIELLQFAKESNVPPFILGGGSNMLLTKDLEALVMKNNILGLDLMEESSREVIVESGAGEVWHDLVLWSMDHEWGGLENLSLIPGLVGAAPIQNIGAYGVEMKDCFVSLDALNRETLAMETFEHGDCDFAYRDSIFKGPLKDKYVITSVRFRLQKQPELNTSYGAIQNQLRSMGIKHPSIKDVSDAVIAIRQSKLPDPKEIGNSGSFFKNPVVDLAIYESLQKNYPEIPSYPLDNDKVKLAAGWLIEQSGWKGKRAGDAGMHSKQALVLVNHGNATGEELLAVSREVQNDVYQKFDIQLEPEVNIL